MTHYTNPALEAELAYRQQRLEASARGRRSWLRRRPRSGR
jgi:hypothetical protein